MEDNFDNSRDGLEQQIEQMEIKCYRAKEEKAKMINELNLASDVSIDYEIVTGANKGIGLEICKQLAQNGITVVLTARDEKRGLEALESLKHSGLSDYLIFHQLDVTDPESIASLADFVKKQFGKLDIL
ncbi:hypothetical protein Gotur_031078, partial [Gossypium turneri]